MAGRGCLLIAVSFFLGMFLVIQPTASARHWCSPLTTQVDPLSGGTGEAVIVTVTLTNGISETLTISSIIVRASWTSIVYNLGSMTLAGGASSSRSDSIQLPSSAGDYQITVTVNGQTPSDFFDEACTAAGVFRVSASVVPYVVGGGIALVAVVVVVALVVVLRRRKPGAIGPPGIAPPPQPTAPPACPVCGQPLGWVAPSNRWYCASCAQFR